MSDEIGPRETTLKAQFHSLTLVFQVYQAENTIL